MKSNIISSFFSKCLPLLTICTLFVLGFSACQKLDEMELNKGETLLALSADKSSVELKEKNRNADAILLSWGSGSNKGTGAAMSYTLKIDKKGNGFKNAVVENLGKAVFSRKYTVAELNNILTSKLGATVNTESELEVKIVMEVANHPELNDSTEAFSLKVKSYQPVTSTLYLIGDATPNGWSADNATAMRLDPNQPGLFTWLGNLSPGDFKMITTKGNFLPSYNKGTDGKLVFRTSNDEADNKFRVEAAGLYTVTVSLLDSAITFVKAAGPAYSRIWIVGDATPNGWNIDNPNELKVDSSNLFIFNYNEVLKAGEFKFPLEKGNWGADFYMPLVNYQNLNLNDMQLVKGGSPDLKWKITDPGPYKIKLDLQEMKIYIKPFVPYTKIWMVGDATPAGWNIDAPTQLLATTGNPYEFTYTGSLNAGEFKFPLAIGNWGCDYFMPLVDGAGVESTQMKFVPGGNPDNKWKITQAGNYTITINQLYETISIVKQ